ncbi:hypothetical protein [Azospirillum argentinense]|uniref:hypothetical protein n=1 Tax=Azospirillum argentinense TaxID=2970906 RepID=UPI0032E02475
MRIAHVLTLAGGAFVATACATLELPPDYELTTLERYDCQYLRTLRNMQDYETWTVTRDGQRIPKRLTSEQSEEHHRTSVVYYQKCRR